MAAVVRAVARHGDLLRVAVATAGTTIACANEAPPAIISVFLGDMLQDIVEQIEKGSAKTTKHGGTLQVGVTVLPTLPRDAGDRNRTSPFAFTGNRFDFRAVGSSQSVAGPNVVMNTIVAESLDQIADRFEQAIAAGKNLNSEIQALLPKVIAEGKKVASTATTTPRRGTRRPRGPACPTAATPSTAPRPASKRSRSSRSMASSPSASSTRDTRSCGELLKTIAIEAQITIQMANRQILPAALRYLSEVALAISSLKATGVKAPSPQIAFSTSSRRRSTT